MMKLLILALLSPALLFALPQSKRINAAITTIPAAFSTAAGSLVISEAVAPKILFLDNRTATEIEVNCAHASIGQSTEVPVASEGTSIWINASTAAILDVPHIKGDCYIRSMGAPITTGVFAISVLDQ